MRVSAPGVTNAGDPDIAVASNGTVAAVWRAGGSIEAAVRPPGGPFGAAQTLGATAAGNTAPRVAISPVGQAIAVWRTSAGDIEENIRPAGGSRTRLTALTVKGANRHETITVGSARITHPRRRTVNLLRATRHVFAAGQTLDIRVTRKGHIAKVVLLTFRAGKGPAQRNRCLRPGSRRLRMSC